MQAKTVAALLLAAGIGVSARAETIVAGGALPTQTWTLAGSPYRVTGDVVVPAGATLTIEAGVTVQFASADGLAAGQDPARVELTVLGALAARGTAAARILLTGVSAGPGSWYGVVLGGTAAGSALEEVDIWYAVHGLSLAATGDNVYTGVSTYDSSTTGLRILAGNPTLVRFSAIGGRWGGIDVGDASATFIGCSVFNNSERGFYFHPAATPRTLTIDRCTVASNASAGIWASDPWSASRVDVVSTIVVSNGQFGFLSVGMPYSVTYSNVWANATNFFGSNTPGVGCISANPLFAPGGSLTSNSPSRGQGAGGVDMGAYPYAGIPTGGLLGTLWSDRTLTAAGSPYTVDGDLTVPPGVTLTLEPGVVLRFAAVDQMGAGRSGLTELNVGGRLLAAGRADRPITLTGASAAPGSWQGVTLESTQSGSALDHVWISYPYVGLRLMASGASTYGAISVAGASLRSLQVDAGSPVLPAFSSTGAGEYGIYVGGGAPVLTGCLVRQSGSSAVQVQPAGAILLDHCTVAFNAGGISGTTSAVRVESSIVASNGAYGIAPAATVAYSNVWSEVDGFTSGPAGVGKISANPLFVSAADLRLTSNSPSRGQGAGGTDMGAFPYAGHPTEGLLGTLWSDTTLTAAGSPHTVLGDLTVPSGVTLTIEPGATLLFAPADLMRAGRLNRDLVELLVSGTLLADGTRSSPITLAPVEPAGGWYGVVMLESATGSVMRHLVIRRPHTGLTLFPTGENTFASIAVEDAGTGAVVYAGSPRMDAFSSVRASWVGLQVVDASPTFTNCVLRDGGRSGVSFGPSSNQRLVLDHCTIANNAWYGVSAGAGAAAAAAEIELSNSIVAGNGSYGVFRNQSGPVLVTYSNIWGNGTDLYRVTAGVGSISADPLFVSGSDLRLRPGSPCVDTGFGGAALDADGVFRGVDGDRDGIPGTDMGAYELVPPIVCGDGFVEGPEECDDGNADDTDGCLSTCQHATCGDGFVRAGVEACDDGNADDTDACLSSCQLATCGDGFVRAGVEACDDGNADDTDGCLSSCVVATCGDGHVQAGVEACDDGNLIDGDGCSRTCALEPPAAPGGCSCGGPGGPAGLLPLALLLLAGRRRRALVTSRGDGPDR